MIVSILSSAFSTYWAAYGSLTLDIVTTILGLLYIWLGYKQNIRMWWVGAVMQVLGIVLYYEKGLYADCGMEFYYMLMTIYGYSMWKYGGKSKYDPQADPTLPVRKMPVSYLLMSFSVFMVLWVFIGFILLLYTDSKVPIADSFTTALSIVGVWALAKKYVEQWLIWLLVDIVTTVLYFSKGIPFKASLYALYCVIAVFGYFKWKAMVTTERE